MQDRSSRVYGEEFRRLEEPGCSGIPKRFRTVVGVVYVLSSGVKKFIAHVLLVILVFDERMTVRV